MAWSPEVNQNYINNKKELYLAGGQSKIDKQHNRGKLTARERMESLFDNGHFNEIEMYAISHINVKGVNKKHYMGDGIVCGYGQVNGKTVYAVATDSTVSGGAGGVTQLEKQCRTLELAIKTKSPYVCLCEGGGARIEEGIRSLSAYSRLFYLNTQASGYIPQIAAIMGNCAGGSSYSPAMCDFIFMVEKTGQLFITGPKVIKATIGMDVSMEELGGAEVHSRYSGQAHYVYQNDIECIYGIRNLLDIITNPKREFPDDAEYDYQVLGKQIEEFVPEDKKRPYDVKEVILRLVDNFDFFEILPSFAGNLVTGFARMGGKSIGIVANQACVNGGVLDCDAADKCSRFVRFCDCFNIPILTLVDVPGYMPGIDEERKGILRHGSKILYAFAEATVPKISIILRKAYGGSYCAMNSKDLGADYVFAWPICEFAVMGAEGAVDVIYHKTLSEAENPQELRTELVEKYKNKYLDPYFAAKCGMVDDVILPEETRKKIIDSIKGLDNKEIFTVKKKHGNISL